MAQPRVIVVLASSGTLPSLAHLISVTPTAHDRRVAPELKSRLHKLKILTIDPLRALGALNTLKASPTSATAIHRYQDDFLGSGISSLSHTLSEYLDFTEPDPCGDNLHLRATTQLRGSLDACKSFLSTKKADLDVVVSGVSELRREIANVQEGLSHKIFDIPQNADPATRSEARAIDEVERSLRDSEKAMKLVMDRLSWWRMVSQVDEISTVVADSVARTWCKDLDAKVGRFSPIDPSILTNARTVLATHSYWEPHLHARAPHIYDDAPTSFSSPLFPRRRAKGNDRGTGERWAGAGVAWLDGLGERGVRDADRRGDGAGRRGVGHAGRGEMGRRAMGNGKEALVGGLA
ncbi:Tryptophan synthase [Salix suchowensis]|nr:Tryptophan synthase [Salix suchowensis]